jgi:phosphoribosylformylglycinamidine cyclo-ligase
VLPDLIRGHPSPHGFDLTAACFGTVALDGLVTGAACEAGDALIGLPSSGLHSNGYSLARAALGALELDERPEALGGASVADALLEPTVIYVRAVLEGLRSGLDVRGLAHITGGGIPGNLARVLPSGLRARIDPARWERHPVYAWVDELGIDEDEQRRVFNLGVGFCAVVPPGDAGDAGLPVIGRLEEGDGGVVWADRA